MWHDYLRVWHAQWHFFARWWWAEAIPVVLVVGGAAVSTLKGRWR